MSLIDKEKLLDDIENEIIINENPFAIDIVNYIKEVFECFKLVIDRQPVIDAVEVVRCKDCAYNYDNNIAFGYRDVCKWSKDETPNPDGYCSFGEKVKK